MGNRNNPHDGQEDPSDTRPYLCIPYWTTPLEPGGSWDTGQERALPGAVVSYACPSIHASPYTPGQPLDVTVEVRNSGGGNSASVVTVVVYWADPTVGFAKPTFFAASAVAVPPSRNLPQSVSTPTMTATIPASAPAHVCLVAVVSHAQDRAGTTCDPINDRHWAQRNLQAVVAAVGAPVLVPITAANPFTTEQTLALRVGSVDERHKQLVAREFRTEPMDDIHPQVRLLDAEGAGVSGGGERIQTAVRLGPLERRQFQLLIQLDRDMPPGRSTAIEVQLIGNDGEGLVVGSLGVVLLPPDRR